MKNKYKEKCKKLNAEVKAKRETFLKRKKVLAAIKVIPLRDAWTPSEVVKLNHKAKNKPKLKEKTNE